MILSYLELIEKAFNEFKTNDLIPTPKDLRDRLHELIGLTDKMPATERDKFIDTHETFKAIHDQYMHEMAIERSWSKSHKDKTAQVWKCLCACKPKITT
jgi:predicted transcriptional regulator